MCDILQYLRTVIIRGDYVAEIGRQLRIKYGLGVDPSATAQASWARRTEELIRRGYTREDAGSAAARELFPDFRTRTYAGEADTIVTLLESLRRK